MLVRKVALFMDRNAFMCTGRLAIRQDSLQTISREVLRKRGVANVANVVAEFALQGAKGVYDAEAARCVLHHSLGASNGLTDAAWSEVRQHVLNRLLPVAPVVVIDDEPANQPSAIVQAPSAASGQLVAAPDAAALSARYEHMRAWPADQHILELSKKDASIETFKKRVRGLQQSLRRARQKIEIVQAAHQVDPNEEFQIELRGKRNLTLQGSMALAVRRNLSSIACADIGSVLLPNVSRWTVARAEVRAASALVASARSFFDQAFGCLKDAMVHRQEAVLEEMPDFLLMAHSIRCDATNSAIWQRRKLTALELESALPSWSSAVARRRGRYLRAQWVHVFSVRDAAIQTAAARLKPQPRRQL